LRPVGIDIEYENELKVMEFYYVDITQELREEYRKNITALYDDFQSVFIQQFNGFIHQTYLLMNGIQQKFFGLKIHSMNQRAMVMSVFVDYCEADFYNTFETCDQHIVLPYLSDQFDTLLHKLVQLDWNAVTSPNNLPGMPIKFSGQLWRDSSYIIESLKNLKMVDINLNDLDNFFDDFWRVRIDSLSLILLDADGYPIQSCGTTFGCEISIKIRFPTIFSDVDYYGEEQSFLALSFSCHSDYYTEGEEVTFISNCGIEEEFSTGGYKASPNGIYSFEITNPEQIDMDSLAQVQFMIGGTRITNLKTKSETWT